VDAERDRDALDRDDLADEAGEVRDRAAELAGEELQEDALLIVGGLVVDEDRCGPRLGFEDVVRDVGETASVRPLTSTPSIVPFSMPQAIVVSQVL
jgi:hypothetical protein